MKPIKINEDILNKASLILHEQRRLADYISTCLRANICPRCGGAVIDGCDENDDAAKACKPCNELYLV